MKKYRVYMEAIASMTVEVEAESEKQAVNLALNEHMPTGPCHQEPFDLGDWDVPEEDWAVAEVTE